MRCLECECDVLECACAVSVDRFAPEAFHDLTLTPAAERAFKSAREIENDARCMARTLVASGRASLDIDAVYFAEVVETLAAIARWTSDPKERARIQAITVRVAIARAA